MSKKLTGNGRWESSRMMLPEHKEALIERRDASPETAARARVPTKEELEMIRDSVLLPIMLMMIEKNGKELLISTNTLRKLYVVATQILMHRIHSELAKVKRELRERNIKVFQDEREDSDLHFRYIYRGYEDKFAIMRDVAKAVISVKISEHIQRMAAELKGNEK
jgi:hypothetical protein